MLQKNLNLSQENQSQSQYQINAIYKGSYSETLINAVAAFRAHQQPAIVQINDIGTATMSNPAGAIVPFYKIMLLSNKKANWHINKNIKQYYSDKSNHLLALPFNISTPVLYYNRDLFSKAGLDPNQAPRSWQEVYNISKKLIRQGAQCGFTTTWPSWIQMENFAAWHNLPFATAGNGFNNVNAHLVFNQPLIVDHISTLQAWQAQHVFVYGGRDDNATSLFTSGQCAMNMQSIGALTGLKKLVSFDLGVSSLPYWEGEENAPQNTLLGGGALWTLSGFDAKVYRGTADFYHYLLQTKTQLYWQTHSGYLTVTQEGVQAASKAHFYQSNPEIKVALDSLTTKPATDMSHGVRLGNYSKLRVIIDEALEEVFSGKRSAQVALDKAVWKGNRLLARFAHNVS